MATNPLSILTYLTASKDAFFKESVNISGAVTAQNGVTVSGGNLSVSAGNISGSGTLQAGGAATLANGLTVTGAPVNASAVAVSASALNVANAAYVGGAATLANGATVTGAPLNASAVAVSASALNVTNAASVGGGLTVTGAPLNANSVAVSASALSVVGSASIGADLTVQGNLTVKGTLTAIDSTTVNIGDLNIALGTGSATLAGINGGGIDLGQGALVQLRYDNANTAWTSNVDMNLATDSEQYKIAGVDVLTKTGTQLEVGAGVSTVMVANDATLAVSGAMRLSGATDFSYITSVTRTNGLYNVDNAIQALDAAVSASFLQGSSNVTALKNAYNDLRAVVTGTLDGSGQAVVILTTYSTASFAVGQIKNVALDIMVDSNNDGVLTNDLVAIRMFTSGSDLKVQIDAPATPSVPYRLIAVNEKDGGLG